VFDVTDDPARDQALRRVILAFPLVMGTKLPALSDNPRVEVTGAVESNRTLSCEYTRVSTRVRGRLEENP
jgi:hypothetical protein